MAAKISKNNPASRDQTRLIVYCPDCGKEMKIWKILEPTGASKMVYRCSNDKCNKQVDKHPQSYKDLPHEFIGKK
jgi:ssDNA-binding Zn-finger/Zn-ribbon topoisomerase 1